MSLTVAARTHAARSSNSLRFACGVLRLKRRRQLIHRECGYRGIEVCVDWLADGSHEKKQGSKMCGLHGEMRGTGSWDNTKITGGTVYGRPIFSDY